MPVADRILPAFRVTVALAAAAAAGLLSLLLLLGLALAAPSVATIGPHPPDLPAVQDVRISSGSGSLLRGWWLPASRPGAGTVILLHGIRNNRLSMLPRARRIAAEGYAVLLFDFQAHGESPGQHITGGKLEALDASAAVRFAHARSPSDRVAVIGTSLGAAAALLGPHPLDVQALVLESVYSDIHAGFANWLNVILGPGRNSLAIPLLSMTFDELLLPLIGVSPRELRPIDRITDIRAPILIATGTEDRIAPLSMAAALYAEASAPKRFWAVDGAAHADLEAFAPDRYWATILPFLAANLHPGPLTLSAQ